MHRTCIQLFANTAFHRDGPSLPDLQRGTNRTEKLCIKSYLTEAQSSSCQRRLLIFTLQQSKICITRKALGKCKSQWLQKSLLPWSSLQCFQSELSQAISWVFISTEKSSGERFLAKWLRLSVIWLQKSS